MLLPGERASGHSSLTNATQNGRSKYLNASRPLREAHISAILAALSCRTAGDALLVSPSSAYTTLSCISNCSPLSCACSMDSKVQCLSGRTNLKKTPQVYYTLWSNLDETAGMDMGHASMTLVAGAVSKSSSWLLCWAELLKRLVPSASTVPDAFSRGCVLGCRLVSTCCVLQRNCQQS